MNIKVTTSCGTATTRYRFKCVSTNSCGGPILPIVVVSPNPVSATLRVSLEENKGIQQEKSTQSIREIRIIDKVGNVKRAVKYGQNLKSVSIDFSGLLPDVYTVVVYDGYN